MFTKKIMGISATILGLSVALAACGPDSDSSSGSGTSEEKKELLVWEDVSKTQGIEDAVKKFEEEYDVKVTVKEMAYADQIEALRLDGAAGTGADVITIPGDQIGTAVTEGLLKELDLSKEEQELYTESAMSSQLVDGKVYGLPKAVETTVLYYNKDLISEDELPTTIDEWYDYSKLVTKGGNYGLLALWDQIYYAQSLIVPYGGYIFAQDENGNHETTNLGLNNEGAVKAVTEIRKFYADGLFPSGIIGEQGINVLDSLFTEGKAAAVISGPWNLEPYKSAGINYGVVELPTLANGEHMSAFLGVKSYNVSSYSDSPELAEKFVKFISNEENSKTRYEKTQEIPAVASLADDPAIVENEAAKAVAEQSKYSEVTPNIAEMAEVWTPIDAALQTVATGKAEPKKALDNAVETIEGQIEANHSANQ